jgi:hypothetical protein
MEKKIFRLTESELRQIVKESVTRILMNEWNGSDELEKDEKRAGSSLEDDDEKTIEEENFGKGGNGRIKGDIFGTRLPKGGSKYARELMRRDREREMNRTK